MLAPDERYAFEPYAYGPMSRGLYGDVRLLCRNHRLEATPIEGATWRLLDLNPAGTRDAERLRDVASTEQPDVLAWQSWRQSRARSAP